LFGSPDRYAGNRDMTFVFLGDFVDRGFYSLETVLLLFSLKVISPNRIVLVRGNHESRSMSWQFGFREELESKLGTSKALALFETINDVFDNLPLACLVSEERKREKQCHLLGFDVKQKNENDIIQIVLFF
jgi:hypothetical protein